MLIRHPSILKFHYDNSCSASSYIKEWNIKGKNLFGQNKSVQPDPDITLTEIAKT